MLEVVDLCKAFGALKVTDRVSFSLAKGERRVVLGPNGAGKTTLFNLLTGELDADSGDIRIQDTRVNQMSPDARVRLGLGRSFQKNNLFSGLTVAESLRLALAVKRRRTFSMWRDLTATADIVEKAEQIADLVALGDQMDTDADELSYGARRQMEVGLALASEPTVILMDEPTSGLGPGMTEAFTRMVAALPRDLTILIIEHDLEVAFDIADTVTVLNFGKVVFEGAPAEARNSDEVREIYLGDWAADA